MFGSSRSLKMQSALLRQSVGVGVRVIIRPLLLFTHAGLPSRNGCSSRVLAAPAAAASAAGRKEASSAAAAASSRAVSKPRGSSSKRPTEPQPDLERLREEIAKHDQLYHSRSAPVLSDAQYDALKARLRQLEASAAPSAAPPPKQSVGAAPSSALPKVRHINPMLSLFSVNSRDEVCAWHAKLLGKLPPAALQAAGPDGGRLNWVVEPKVDGLAVSLVYEDGKLVRAATRGDGEEGEDVTHNCPVIKGLPLTLEGAGGAGGGGGMPTRLEVRGEVYMTHAALEQVNQEQVQAGLAPFANTRNAAAGSVRLLSPQQCATRQLSFVAYQLLPLAPAAAAGTSSSGGGAGGGAGDLPLGSHWECLQWLAARGFATSGDAQRVSGGMEAALEEAGEWMGKRLQLGYDADGVVFKLEDLALQRALGHVGADPQWALALKFPSSEAVTKLLGVQLNVGRTGQVTPVAELEPVTIGGVTIQNATLHNIGYIAALDLRVGDTVLLQRAGDVIPKVVRALPELRCGTEIEWKPPGSCPNCGSTLEVEAGGKGSGATLWCRNPACSAQAARQVLHFASTCLETSNVGPAVVTQLMEAGLVGDMADFFSLTQDQLLPLPRFGAKRSDSVLRGIDKARGMPLHLLLAGLNIRHVGAKTGKDLGKAFGSAQQLQGATMEQLTDVQGIGKKTAEAISAWMLHPDNRELLQRLDAAGVTCVQGTPGGASVQAAAPGPAGPAPTPAPAPASASRAAVPAAAKKASKKRAAAAAAPGAAAAPSPPPQAAAVSPPAASPPPAGGRGPVLDLQGQSVVVTGALEFGTREEFEQLVEASGGALVGGVSRSTLALVVGEKPGQAKLDKALKLGVPVLTEEEFFEKYAG